MIPGMMRRFHEARRRGDREVVVWGTGAPRREFLHVDDLADALYTLMMRYDEPGTINVGTGSDLSIRDLAEMMRQVTGFEGTLTFDSSRPDGTPRKLLDVSRLQALGWRPRIELAEGLEQTYAWARQNSVFNDS